LKQAIPASGLVMMPKTGHAVNLEEPDLFNRAVSEFLARVEAGHWPPRDPRTRSAEGVPLVGTRKAQ
jgi:proline iminopeptidase